MVVISSNDDYEKYKDKLLVECKEAKLAVSINCPKNHSVCWVCLFNECCRLTNGSILCDDFEFEKSTGIIYI